MARILDFEKIDCTPLPDYTEDCDREEVFQETLASILDETNSLKHRASDLAIALRVKESAIPASPQLKDVYYAWLKQGHNKKQGPPTWRLLARRVADDTGGADRALALNIQNRHPVGGRQIVPTKGPIHTNTRAQQETYDGGSAADPPSRSMSTSSMNSNSSWSSTNTSSIDRKFSTQFSIPEEEQSSFDSQATPTGTMSSTGPEENRRIEEEEEEEEPIVKFGAAVSSEASVHPPINRPAPTPNVICSVNLPATSPNVTHPPPSYGTAVQQQSDGKGAELTHLSKPEEARPEPGQAEHSSLVEDDGKGILAGILGTKPKQPTSLPDKPHPLKEHNVGLRPYKMDRQGGTGYHGYALIINNINISGRDKRMGAEQDDKNLADSFNRLGYQCLVHRDQTAQEMREHIDKLTKQTDHTHCDSVICCLLSHGDAGKVYGVDDRSVHLEDVKRSVIDCKSLVGKPKIFIVQSCRGTRLPGARAVESDDDSTTNKILLPEESDLFFGYATTPHTKACRFTDDGSWYVIELCRAFNTYHKQLDLLNMVQLAHYEVATNKEYVYEVNERTSDGRIVIKKYKQSPQMVSTLLRPVWF